MEHSIDREKVIKGIRKCLSHRPCSENGCPYENECAVEHLNDPLLRDALALLKEQDEKQMIENEIGWNCPSCGMNLIGKTSSGYPCDLIDLPEDEPIHFCPKCGQAVKWE